jgi:pyruvate formate lyase activating enzyme
VSLNQSNPLYPARYCEVREGGAVKCLLCPRDCLINPESDGFCGVRVNAGGTLYSAIYAEVASVALDPIEKKPLYHFHPGSSTLSFGTLSCNMRCRHCQNWNISYARILEGDLRETQTIHPKSAVVMLKECGADGVSFTYNEPTIWIEYILDVFGFVRATGKYTSIVTNGYISAVPLADLLKLTDAYRVDLKFMRTESAMTLAQVPDHTVILDRIVQAKKAGVHIELVTNVVTTVNDSTDELTAMAKWIAGETGVETPWHITKSFPKPHWDAPPTPTDTIRKAIEIGKSAGLKHIYPGNVYGFDADTKCPKCGHVAIDRSGYSVVLAKGLPICSECGYRMNIVVD